MRLSLRCLWLLGGTWVHVTLAIVLLMTLIYATGESVIEVYSTLQGDQDCWNITIYGDAINQVDSVKYLGIVTDDRLTWRQQLVQIQTVVQGKLAILRRLSHYLSCALLENIYLSWLYSLTLVTPGTWNTLVQSRDFKIMLPESLINISNSWCRGLSVTRWIQRLQTYGARISYQHFEFVNVRDEELVKKLGCQPLDKRRNFHTTVLMFKYIHKLAPD